MGDSANKLKEFLAINQDIKKWDFQKSFHLTWKIICDKKILLLSVLLFVIIYFLDYSFLFQPAMETFKKKSDEYTAQMSVFKTKEGDEQHFKDLAKQVKELPVYILNLKPGQASTVVALAESQKLIDIIKNLASANSMELPESYKYIKFVNIDLVSSTPSAATGPATNAGKDQNNSQSNPQAGLSEFVYKLKMEGTYAALATFINKLVLLPELLVIDQVDISRAQPGNEKEKAKEPDAAQEPDYPIPLQMEITVSIFLHPNISNS